MNLFKKAQGINYLAGAVVIFLFGFFSLLAYTVWIEVVNALTTGGFYVGQVKVTIDAFTNGFLATDYLIVLLVIIIFLAIAFTSYKISTDTAFFIITIIVGFFWCAISYFFNYVFIQLVSPSVFSTAWGVFPRTLIICTNLHWIVLIELIIGSITLYGKKEKAEFLS